MSKSPRLKGQELIKILHRIGFEIIRIKGSHHFLRNSKGLCTVVPVHSGEIIGPGLFLKILRDIEMSKEGFEKLRRYPLRELADLNGKIPFDLDLKKTRQ